MIFLKEYPFQHRIELEGSTCLYISEQVSFWISCWRSGKNRFALFPGFSVASHGCLKGVPPPSPPPGLRSRSGRRLVCVPPAHGALLKKAGENFQFCSFSASSFQCQYAPQFHPDSRPAAVSQFPRTPPCGR